MFSTLKTPDTFEKLEILSRDAQYDLACACATKDDEHRRRSREDKWIYPVVMPQGGTTFLFKTLLSNECRNNCKYCPLRAASDSARVTLSPQELAKTFLAYYRQGRVSGLFLSSGACKNPDTAMGNINAAAQILRRSAFRGYIHLKVIPGASEQAIRHSLSLATAVSLNIEAPGEDNFRQLSTTKDYVLDITAPIELISRLTRRGAPFAGVHQTTQFVVGAASETDQDILGSMGKLYGELKLNRVYFSAYQRGLGTPDLYGENSSVTNRDLLNREHRLYQADWLVRKYGFAVNEIPLDAGGYLSLAFDPKEHWAKLHPEFFPVNINRADKNTLLRVPGLGQIMVNRILAIRQAGSKINSFAALGKAGKVINKALPYLSF